MKKKQYGFTLAELLIVVSIISVLTATAVPLYTKQLEKSREATDLANVRSAYAKLMNAVISEEKTSGYWDDENNLYKTVVPLKQKYTDWETYPLRIADVSVSEDKKNNAQWLGLPGADGKCEIAFNPVTNLSTFTWSGKNTSPTQGQLTVLNPYAWNGSGYNVDSLDSQKKEKLGKGFSTYFDENVGTKYEGLKELEPDTKYEISFTYDPATVASGHRIMAGATLIFGEDGKCKADSGTAAFKENGTKNGVQYSYKTDPNTGLVTYTATFTTPKADVNNSKYYYGMNFNCRTQTGDGDTERTFASVGITDAQVQAAQKSVLNTFEIKKV
ncbi:MAG: type II secretion system protein [Erysipelotrichaceae bacterium]|nr:type II secretion system protein [Erysipelotrichaceae bacterium]